MGNIDDRNIASVLDEIEGGRFADDLSTALRKIITAVMDTRKNGKLKLSISIAPTGRSSVEIDAHFDATIPEHDRPSTTFFVDSNNVLHRDDPEQDRLPLQEVPRSTEPLRMVGGRKDE
jgi:hypothetical protein